MKRIRSIHRWHGWNVYTFSPTRPCHCFTVLLLLYNFPSSSDLSYMRSERQLLRKRMVDSTFTVPDSPAALFITSREPSSHLIHSFCLYFLWLRDFDKDINGTDTKWKHKGTLIHLHSCSMPMTWPSPHTSKPFALSLTFCFSHPRVWRTRERHHLWSYLLVRVRLIFLGELLDNYWMYIKGSECWLT